MDLDEQVVCALPGDQRVMFEHASLVKQTTFPHEGRRPEPYERRSREPHKRRSRKPHKRRSREPYERRSRAPPRCASSSAALERAAATIDCGAPWSSSNVMALRVVAAPGARR